MARVMPKAAAPVARNRFMTRDTLENLLSGMGTSRDKNMFASFIARSMSRAQLEAAYRGDWIARKVIDIPAYDSTREWRAWQADKKDITLLEEQEQFFNLQRKVFAGMSKARLYGGGALVLGVDQGSNEEELDLEKIRAGDLKFIHVVSRNEITAGPMNLDILSPFYGEPLYYERTTGQMVRLHPSRVIRFIGLEPPEITSSDGWGDPVMQVVVDALVACGSVTQGVATLVQEAQVDVIRIPQLSASLVSPEYEERLKARFGLAADAKSIYKMLLLDKEEEWQRITANFASLPDIIRMYLMIASGAADIPATRMLGQSPAGLSATGESDTRNYYDRIKSEQKTVLQPVLQRLDEVLIRATFGKRPDEMFYNWNSLWQLDDVQKATLFKSKADTFKVDVDAGLVDPVVLKLARQNQLIEDGVYPGIEQIIEENEVDATNELGGFNDPEGDGTNPEPPSRVFADPAEQSDTAKRVRTFDASKRVMPKKKKKRKVNDDAHSPRTLYVSRPLLNWKVVADHFKAQGLKKTVGKDMHVTIAYSRKHVDWMLAGESWGQDEKGNLTVRPGGVRIVDQFGDATVLVFMSTDLVWRWSEIKERTEAEWAWPDYQPHVTITWDKGNVDLAKVEPYRGELVFGPEVFEEVNEDFKEGIVEDAKAEKLFKV